MFGTLCVIFSLSRVMYLEIKLCIRLTWKMPCTNQYKISFKTFLNIHRSRVKAILRRIAYPRIFLALLMLNSWHASNHGVFFYLNTYRPLAVLQEKKWILTCLSRIRRLDDSFFHGKLPTSFTDRVSNRAFVPSALLILIPINQWSLNVQPKSQSVNQFLMTYPLNLLGCCEPSGLI